LVIARRHSLSAMIALGADDFDMHQVGETRFLNQILLWRAFHGLEQLLY